MSFALAPNSNASRPSIGTRRMSSKVFFDLGISRDAKLVTHLDYRFVR